MRIALVGESETNNTSIIVDRVHSSALPTPNGYGRQGPKTQQGVTKKRKLRQSCALFQLCQCFKSTYARNVINLAFLCYLQDMSS